MNRLNIKTGDHRWLFIGSQSLATEFNKDFGKHKYTGQLVCHIIRDSEDNADSEISDYRKLIKEPWNGVIIDSLNTLPSVMAEDLLQQRLSGMKIFSLTEFYSKQWTKVPIFNIGEHWLMDVDGFSLLEDSVNYKLKRVFDIMLSICLGLALMPVMLVIGIVCAQDFRWPGLLQANQSRVEWPPVSSLQISNHVHRCRKGRSQMDKH